MHNVEWYSNEDILVGQEEYEFIIPSQSSSSSCQRKDADSRDLLPEGFRIICTKLGLFSLKSLTHECNQQLQLSTVIDDITDTQCN